MKVRTKLFELYKDLGVKHNLKTFENRKQLQKLTYLIEIFGIPLGFGFSWYIHGPYDRSLTAVLYDDHPEYSDRDVKQSKNESQKIANLKEFLGTDIHNSRTLELIVSLHYLYHIGKKNNTSDQKILEQLSELKPQFQKEESEYHLKRIKKYLE